MFVVLRINYYFILLTFRVADLVTQETNIFYTLAGVFTNKKIVLIIAVIIQPMAKMRIDEQ